jgi:thermopsin
MITYSGMVDPSNSFVFVSPGSSFNNTTAAWAPIGMNGNYHFTLPAGSYSAVAMLSDHNPMYFTPGSGDVSLALNSSQGLYTPLYAMSVQQLQNISTESSGTYTIYNNYSPGINPLFGELNDYLFPAFVGVMIADLNVPITIQNMPYLTVTFQGYNALLAAYYSVPSSDQMSYVIYNSSEVTVKDNTFTGWFSSNLDEFPVANLLLWNSTNINVTSNTFITMDSSMLIYNEHSVNANNIVTENFFIQSSALNRYNYAPIAISTSLGTLAASPTGLTVYSSGNTIYGNGFAVYLTAISLNYSIYSGNYVVYKDYWNTTISGYNVGNYHPYAHDFAYNNYGLITSGYDFHPHKLPGFGALVHDFERA